uniref:4-hydroxyphenylpyruvate dioxygenase n=1 Tax=Anthurium amnicola TaxID=1678845 RepID=A0A1D1XRF2_9ARAE
MGCVCSSGPGKVDDGDALSFSNMVVADDDAGFCARRRKATKAHKESDAGKMSHDNTGASEIPEASSILGRAGIVGLQKAVEALDTLGSSMSLNAGSGFVYGMMHRGNKISILAFEVANTIAKGASLMRSLSEENVQLLKNEILQSDGVQLLVSSDIQELLSIVAADKREEFDVFSKEVVRFGDLCKDPQWHNLARYFQKLDSDPTPQQQLKDESETIMQHLMNLTQYTSELYHELNALDRFEQDYHRKLQEEESLPTSRGENLTILHRELKHQRKFVKSLKKKSLWSRNLEEVVEKLVDIVTFLHKEIFEAFGHTGMNVNCKPDHASQRLGTSGLALHYANIINQIDNVVSRPISIPPNTRDTLYHGLPASVKAALRARLQSFDVKEELTIALIKNEMQKILQWLIPMADSTIKAHQGFGWVGEWANMSTELNKRSVQQYNVIHIQTLHHADKEKTEEWILQLAVWLHHLVSQVKNRGFGLKTMKSIRHPSRKTTHSSFDTKQGPSLVCSDKNLLIFQLSEEEREMLDSVSSKRLVLGRSKSHGCITRNEKKGRRWLRSSGSSPAREPGTGLQFCIRRTKVLDVLDGLDILEPSFPISSFYA